MKMPHLWSVLVDYETQEPNRDRVLKHTKKEIILLSGHCSWLRRCDLARKLVRHTSSVSMDAQAMLGMKEHWTEQEVKTDQLN